MFKFVKRVKERTETRLFNTNPILRHMNGQDYRIGLARDWHKYKIRNIGNPRSAFYFFEKLISTFFNATDEEKTEFLQCLSARRKLFSLMHDLLYFFQCQAFHDIYFSYYFRLTKILEFNSNIENEYYYMNNSGANFFLQCCFKIFKEVTAVDSHFDNLSARLSFCYSKGEPTDNICNYLTGVLQKKSAFAICFFTCVFFMESLSGHNYWKNDCAAFWRTIELNSGAEALLFSSSNLLSMLEGTRSVHWVAKGYMLNFIRKTSAYHNHEISNEQILTFQSPLDLRLMDSEFPPTQSDFSRFATELVVFMKEPKTLRDYFINCTADQIAMLELTIGLEQDLRQAKVAQATLRHPSRYCLTSRYNEYIKDFYKEQKKHDEWIKKFKWVITSPKHKHKLPHEIFSVERGLGKSIVDDFCGPHGWGTLFYSHIKSSPEIEKKWETSFATLSPDMAARAGAHEMSKKQISGVGVN